jgi:anti-sigma regulatory factor (Ser/Thr protein kinase)
LDPATPRFRRIFEGSVEQLAPIREFVVQAGAELGGGDEDIFALELACDEAAANVFNHAFSGKPGALEIEMWREKGERDVFVRMRHHGRSFDPTRVPPPDLDSPIEERPMGGLGLYFMRKVMTDVTFEFDTRRGNVLTMRRIVTG